MQDSNRTVYVINKSSHDFSPAHEFGQLEFLSKGEMNRYSTNRMFRQFLSKLASSKPSDLILTTGLSTMNVVACSIFVTLHGRLNLLLFKDGRYVERTLVFDNIKENLNDIDSEVDKAGSGIKFGELRKEVIESEILGS